MNIVDFNANIGNFNAKIVDFEMNIVDFKMNIGNFKVYGACSSVTAAGFDTLKAAGWTDGCSLKDALRSHPSVANL